MSLLSGRQRTAAGKAGRFAVAWDGRPGLSVTWYEDLRWLGNCGRDGRKEIDTGSVP